MASRNTITLLAGVGVIMALVGVNPLLGGIGALTIILAIVGLELVGVLKQIPVLQTLSGRQPKGTLAIMFVAILVLGGFLGSIAIGNVAKTASIPDYSNYGQPDDQISTAPSAQVMNANFKFYPANATGSAYAGSGVVYVLDPLLVPDRFTLMKTVADGKTASLTYGGAQASPISVSSGLFQKNQLSGKVNDQVELCGYQDSSPAAGESVSFCKTATLTGITAGSDPIWMWAFADTGSVDYSWRNYATTAYYDATEAARTGYKETEASAIEKTLTFSVMPTNNGEVITDAALYLEGPASNAGAIKSIKITGPTGQIVTYTALANTGTMSSGAPEFIASPALTTSTDTMYFIGRFPEDGVRTSTSDKAKFTIETVYDHPASGNVNFYFKAVQNVDAKSVSGGHFDFGGTSLNLNMTDAGSDAWS